jgi:signal transduction histidine kinase
MSSPQHRRLVFLLLLALLIPAAVLVFLGVRVIRQERELSEKRRHEEEEALAGQVGRELLHRLERIKLQELSALAGASGSETRCGRPPVPAVVVARIIGGQLAAPWEDGDATREFRKSIEAPGFAEKLQQGDRAEFVEHQFSKAAAHYREALATSRRPAQEAYALLRLAAVLAKAGDAAAAREQHRKVLALPSSMIDDQGIPIRLYGASWLAKTPSNEEAVAEVLKELSNTEQWLAPAACYLMRDVCDSLSAKCAPLRPTVAQRITEVEQVVALIEEFPRLAAVDDAARRSANGDPVWHPFGREPWLVSAAHVSGELSPVAIAVHAAPFFDAIAGSWPVKFVPQVTPQRRPLGISFPGLYLVTVQPQEPFPDRWNLRQQFYAAALVLVLAVTLVGGYLLWRDVQRELHMADLRGQFVSSVSHELRTPLTAIRMFAETLRDGRLKEAQARDEYLETIVNESERLTRLVDNVLDFSRIERGTKVYRRRPSSLDLIVRAAARAVHYPLESLGFHLDMEIQDNLSPVNVDSDALEQAVINLLTNAMKYSGNSREIGLTLRSVDSAAEIAVTDHGIGIPPGECERIFEKFYRVPGRENELVPGTGLGLTLVEHVVKSHGGTVSVESCLGKGTTFVVRIPLEDGR